MKHFMSNYSPALAWYLVIGSSIFAVAWLLAVGLVVATFVSHGFEPAPTPLVNTTVVFSSILGLPMLGAVFFLLPAMLFHRSVFGR